MSGLTFLNMTTGGRSDRFADLLCVKRTAFDHEAEVRLLFHDIEPRRGEHGVFKFPLDPNAVFEEVVLDPRTDETQADELKAKLTTAGCTLSMRRSRLYESPSYVIPAQ